MYYHGPEGPVLVHKTPINVTGSNEDLIAIAAEPGRRIRVIGFFISFRSATTLTVKSGASTILSGPIDAVANQMLIWNNPLYGSFETLPGEALVFNVTGNNKTIGGLANYVLI